MQNIIPDRPLQVLYNAETNQLGLSSENWPCICIINFVPFVRTPATSVIYKASYGPSIGYVKQEGVVDKSETWDVVGEL